MDDTGFNTTIQLAINNPRVSFFSYINRYTKTTKKFSLRVKNNCFFLFYISVVQFYTKGSIGQPDSRILSGIEFVSCAQIFRINLENSCHDRQS